MASPTPHRTRGPGHRRRRRPEWRRWRGRRGAGAAAGGRCSQTCHATGSEGTRRPIPAHTMARIRPAGPRAGHPAESGAGPRVAPWTQTSCGSQLPLGRTGGRGRSMGRTTTRSRREDEPPPDRSRARGRTRHRRAGRYGAPERSSAHSPARRGAPTTRPPAGPPNDGPAQRAPAHRAAPTVGGGTSPSLRWVPWIVLALIAAAFVVSSLAGGSSSKADLTYSQFVNAGRQRQREEHRLQQVDRLDQRQVQQRRSTASTEFSSSGPKDNLPDRAARAASRRRTSTSTTSTRAATSSATSCCGCCRSC